MATASKTASSTTAAAAGDGPDAEQAKRLDKVKKEIRSILQTAAKTGLTVNDLERDFRDLNGRPIPFRDLGFSSLYELLDAIPDVIDAYDVSGDVILFAKSTQATAHLEDLIAKAKTSKLGRFGGVINQPAVCRRGTPERRKLIEKRLIEVASKYSSFVSYYDLFSAYQEKYFEPLDSRGDYGVQPKQLFTIKLSHAFDVKAVSSASGSFSVRLKDEVRQSLASSKAAENSATNILGPGGFGQQQVPPPHPPPQRKRTHTPPPIVQENRENIPPTAASMAPFSIRTEDLFYSQAPMSENVSCSSTTAAASTASFSIRPEQLFYPPVFENSRDSSPSVVSSPVAPFQIRPEQLFHPHAPPPPVFTSTNANFPSFMPLPPSMAGMQIPYGPMQFAGQAFQQNPTRYPVVFAPVNVSNMPPHFVGPPAHYVSFPQFNGAPPPFMHPLSFAPPVTTAPGDPRMPTTAAFPPSFFPGHPLMVQQQHQRHQQQQQKKVVTPTSTLDVNAPVFEPKSSSTTTSEIEITRPPAVPSLPSAAELFVEPKVSTPTTDVQTVASASSAVSENGFEDRQQENASVDSKISVPRDLELEQRVTESAAKTKLDETVVEDEVRKEEERARLMEILKEECKTVLSRFPAGIQYFEFGKAYREVIGKDLNLEPCDFLSVNELFEAFPNVFVTRKTERGILLFDKSRLDDIAQSSTASAFGKSADPVEKWVEGASEDALVAQLWHIAMTLPDRTLFIDQIPRVYKISTGKIFPIKTEKLDDFALKLFDYTDRFEFKYEGGLRVIAQQEFDESPLEKVEQDSGTSKSLSFVQVGELYQQQPLPLSAERLQLVDDSDPSRFFQVIVAQIFTPGQFYVQLKSTFADLEQLANDMLDYYTDKVNANDTKIATWNARINLPCACKEDGIWHRGLIKEVGDSQNITVQLVDHGTEEVFGLDEIRYLPRHFFKFPSQAIETRLAVLSPVGEAWSVEAGERLYELCGSSVLWAELYKIEEDGIPQIFLTLPGENGEETHISDALISSGLALFNESEIETGVAGLDLEGEIESPVAGNSPVPWKGENGGEESTSITDMLEDILNTELEEKVVNELTQAADEGGVDLEVFHMARVYLIRRRVAIRDLFTQLSADSVSVAVDKLNWLEQKIQWLTELCQ